MTMSEDLIRRSDAIEAIEDTTWYHQNRNGDMVSGANDTEHQAWYKADDVYKALEAVPSVDRPQGEWIFCREFVEDTPFTGCRCSNCNYWQGMGSWNFCPNCGAKMDGGRDQ